LPVQSEQGTGGTEGRRDEGTEGRRHKGTKARRHEGTKARRQGGTEARRHGKNADCAIGYSYLFIRPPLRGVWKAVSRP